MKTVQDRNQSSYFIHTFQAFFQENRFLGQDADLEILLSSNFFLQMSALNVLVLTDSISMVQNTFKDNFHSLLR
jgi:hypothetical protein